MLHYIHDCIYHSMGVVHHMAAVEVHYIGHGCFFASCHFRFECAAHQSHHEGTRAAGGCAGAVASPSTAARLRSGRLAIVFRFLPFIKLGLGHLPDDLPAVSPLSVSPWHIL